MWETTDPDNYQFCYEIDDKTFLIIELNSEYDDLDVDYVETQLNLNDYNKYKAVLKSLGYTNYIAKTIDLEQYSEEEIDAALLTYYDDLESVYSWPEANQIIAECLFEIEIYE